MFASEYGWTKDYILHEVYPLEAFSLFPQIANRQLNHFIDLLQVQILTDYSLEPAQRHKAYNSTETMRTGSGGAPPPDPKLDRNKLEALRKAMGQKKGKAPVRVK